MASIYRPSYTEFDRKTGKRVLKKCKNYTIIYRDAHGVKRSAKGFSDKAATRALAVDIERRVARERAGLIDPQAEGAGRPIADHVADYRAYLEGRGDSPRHVVETIRAVERWIAHAGHKRITDLSAKSLTDFQSVLKQDGGRRGKTGRGARTLNSYLVAAKGFTRWLVRDRRLPVDPLAHLSRLNEDADRRHTRRALDALEEFARLLDAARAGQPFRKLAGPDRAILYLVAAYTGLRRNELRQLTPESFARESNIPTASVEAAYSKRRRRDTLPIPPELAEQLKPWLAAKTAGQPLWPGSWWWQAAAMLQADLAAAGIPYQDASGRAFDFHALRSQYGTMLARAGVLPQVAQRLMRHSDMKLTLRHYTHLELSDLQQSVGKLPAPPLPAEKLEQKLESEPAARVESPGQSGTPEGPRFNPPGRPQVSERLGDKTIGDDQKRRGTRVD